MNSIEFFREIYKILPDILLDKYPAKGLPMPEQSAVDRRDNIKIIIPGLVSLYNFSKQKSDAKFRHWIYASARQIYLDDCEKKIAGVAEYYHEFSLIQQEAIKYYLDPSITEEQRIVNGQLYRTGYKIIMSGNIPNGRNLSVCSNCFEPINHDQAICRCCNYPLIIPDGYSAITFPQWSNLKPSAKGIYHESAFEVMEMDISSFELKRAWNDLNEELMPLYIAMGLYPRDEPSVKE